MAETTEMQKQAEAYERRLKEQEQRHERELERAMHHAEVRFKEADVRHREQADELRAQADGILSALGRVSKENEQLKQDVERQRLQSHEMASVLEAKRRDFQQEALAHISEADSKRKEAEREVKAVFADLERTRQDAKLVCERADAEICDLKEQLRQAKGGKPRK